VKRVRNFLPATSACWSHNLLHLKWPFFNLKSQSLMQFSRSLLPRSVEKRPRRLWLEIEIKWHSKCNRLYLRKPSRVTCESVISHLWPRHVTHGCVMSHMNWSFLHPSALMKHQHTHTHIHTHTYTHDLSRHSGALIHVRPLQWRNDMHTHTHTKTHTDRHTLPFRHLGALVKLARFNG